MSLPAIGVVIPCYKAEHTLHQTVESVLQGAPDNLLAGAGGGRQPGRHRRVVRCPCRPGPPRYRTAPAQRRGIRRAQRGVGYTVPQRCRVGAVCGCGRYPAAGAVAGAARCALNAAGSACHSPGSRVSSASTNSTHSAPLRHSVSNPALRAADAPPLGWCSAVTRGSWAARASHNAPVPSGLPSSTSTSCKLSGAPCRHAFNRLVQRVLGLIAGDHHPNGGQAHSVPSLCRTLR